MTGSGRTPADRAAHVWWIALLVPLLLLAACRSGSGGEATPPDPGASIPVPLTTAGEDATASPTAAWETSPDPALAACPARVPPTGQPWWVPAPPTTETEGRLVPDAHPVEALLCRYGPLGPDGAGPNGAVLVDVGLRRLRSELDLPGGKLSPCSASAAQLPHLLRLTYADGELWLMALQGCDGATNGAFSTAAPLGERLAQAYATRTWPTSPE